MQVGSIANIAMDYTGGHEGVHSGPKPVGTNTPSSGMTDGGYFPTAYSATDVAGDEEMDVSWTVVSPTSECAGFSGVDQYYHATRWEGLVQLAQSPYYTFAPISSHHNNVYYVAAGINTMADKAGHTYFEATHRTEVFTVTAASLWYGGLEDINNNWNKPHATHQIGTDVDFDGSADSPRIWNLIRLASVNGGGFKKCDVHNKNHVHCYAVLYN